MSTTWIVVYNTSRSGATVLLDGGRTVDADEFDYALLEDPNVQKALTAGRLKQVTQSINPNDTTIRQDARDAAAQVLTLSGQSYSPPQPDPTPTSWPQIAQIVGTGRLSADAIQKRIARTPEQIITGALTRDANGAVTSAAVTWPDGTAGVFTATTVSTAFPGAVDAYTITYGNPTVLKTYTQPAVTRDSTTGAVTNCPPITVT